MPDTLMDAAVAEIAVGLDARAAIKHVRQLLFDPAPPEPPASVLDATPGLAEVHKYLLSLRDILERHSKGDFTRDIGLRGVVAGRLKALQAHLQHLIWQMQQVMAGDFTQRVDFMGDFSIAFNSMVVQLDDALNALRQKESELTRLAKELESEVARRGTALMEIRRQEKAMKHLGEGDIISGVMGRRDFAARALSEIEKCGANSRFCCLVMLEVDSLQELIDSYGSSAGDIAVRKVVEVAKNRLRHCDIISRYSNNSFAVLLVDADEQHAERVIDRIHSAVAANPLNLAIATLKLSVSIGIA
ncbi:MAG: GGDEF domain-containing protein, partial [Planctomycetota bacterium]|nr:GGDEF domain-containing protein [Planctomycetota bacterium]